MGKKSQPPPEVEGDVVTSAKVDPIDSIVDGPTPDELRAKEVADLIAKFERDILPQLRLGYHGESLNRHIEAAWLRAKALLEVSGD